MRMNLSFIQETTSAVSIAGNAATSLGHAANIEASSVVIDSREAVPGCLFVCIPGEHVDGHLFAGQAVAAGAVAVLAQHDPFAGNGPVPVLVVDDTVRALGLLARAARAKTTATVVGITGTAGKTTVKEVLAQILEQNGETARNKLNMNNQIGLPLSMLNASDTARYWVMEAGISNPGDMDELGDMLRPNLALVLNAGPGHMQGLGDRGVAHYKARFLKYVAPEGMAFVSADYPELVREGRAVRQDLFFFSTTGRQVDYRAAYVFPAGEGKGLYRLWLDGDSIDVEAPFQGRFGAENVIAVAAMAHKLGITTELIATGLARAELPKQRFACSREGDWLIIDDSYNSNPLSTSRMLEAAREMAGEDPLVCVLGEMLELGSVADEEHEKLGRLVAEMKAKALFWKGAHVQDVTFGLERERFSGLFCTVTTCADIVEGLRACNVSRGVILFKGSRANHLETFVTAFVEHVRSTHAV